MVRALRYVLLTCFTLLLAFAGPAGSLGQELLGRVTNPQLYVQLVRQLGANQAGGRLVDLERLLPEMALTYLRASPRASTLLQELQTTVDAAVDRTLVGVAQQIPDYLTGKQEHLRGTVDLQGLRQQVVRIVVEVAPGGVLLQGVIRSAVDTAVPQTIAIDQHLAWLEAVLTPLRTAVQKLDSWVPTLSSACFFALAWMVLLAFYLAPIGIWTGAALALAGALALLTGQVIWGLLGLLVPGWLLESYAVQAAVVASLDGLQQQGVWWIGSGAALIALCLGVPLLAARVARAWSAGQPGRLLVALVPPGRRSSLTTVLALFPAALGLALSPRRGLPGAVLASLGGRVIAVALIDCLLVALLLVTISGGDPLTTPSLVALLLSGILLVVYGLVRDRRAVPHQVNPLDAASLIHRSFPAQRNATWSSLRRALPLLAGLALSPLLGPLLAFGCIAAGEIITVIACWPNRTLGDLLAGARVRTRAWTGKRA